MKNINYLFFDINKKLTLCFYYISFLFISLITSYLYISNVGFAIIILFDLLLTLLTVIITNILLKYHKDVNNFENTTLLKLHKQNFHLNLYVENLLIESWKFYGFVFYKTKTKINEKVVNIKYFKFPFFEFSNFNKIYRSIVK